MNELVREVLDALRAELARPSFVDHLGGRIRQLGANMVDGRVLPKPDAEELRAALVELVRVEALPKLCAKDPEGALALLDMLASSGWTHLEEERAALERARAARFPAPPRATWPELDELASGADCTVQPPVDDVYFAAVLRDDGLPLPDELLALYAAHDGFDLAWMDGAVPIPVFGLLPSASVDERERAPGYPRRVACFGGGDGVQLSVYRDRKKAWWLVYEYDDDPIAKRPLDLEDLLRFGLARRRASSFEALNDGELSWERYFEVADEA